ncbi:hypothetical protein, partial [Klebsiella oxytoca]|uniref:hypothetical protein n=1 Tax=Klebsiella oxytoca TaxID=571 RepID=UPI00287C36A9
ADRNRSHWSTSKTPSYTKSVSWQHHRIFCRQRPDLSFYPLPERGNGLLVVLGDRILTEALFFHK